MKTRRALRYQKLRDYFGWKCVICGGNYYLTIHEKYGRPHKSLTDMTLTEVEDTIKNHGTDYVQVCWTCHKHIHWCMKYLGLKWTDIERSSIIVRSNERPL